MPINYEHYKSLQMLDFIHLYFFNLKAVIQHGVVTAEFWINKQHNLAELRQRDDTVCLSEKASVLAESNTALISSPLQQEFRTGAVNLRRGHCHRRQMPASVAWSPLPSPPLSVTPTHTLLQFFTPAPGYRPSLIKGADSPCPHPDPSSLEHVNLPVTYRYTHTHLHTYAADAHLVVRGCPAMFTWEIGATNPKTQ